MPTRSRARFASASATPFGQEETPSFHARTGPRATTWGLIALSFAVLLATIAAYRQHAAARAQYARSLLKQNIFDFSSIRRFQAARVTVKATKAEIRNVTAASARSSTTRRARSSSTPTSPGSRW